LFKAESLKEKSNMLRKWIVLAVLATLAAGCTQLRPNMLFGSATLTTKDFQVQDFNRVQAENGFRVNITQGEPFKVTVTTHDNIMEYVKVEKNGNTLRLYVDPRPFMGYSINRLEAAVVMPTIAALNGSGGSQLNIAGFPSQTSFVADLSGGSRLNGDMSATDLRMESSGGSNATLAGIAGTLNYTGSGGGRSDLSALEADRATVELSGGASLTVNAAELSYDLSGGSHLRYFGNPQMGMQKTSGGARATSVTP
jgi:hypothetical protein